MKYRFSFILGGAALLAALAQPTYPQTRVVDGDTIVHSGERIRVWGLDCPENYTLEGQHATRRARSLIEGNRIIITDRKGTDRYGRTVARVLVQRISRAEFFTLDFACQMIQSGACREYTRYSHNFYRSCKP